MVSALARCSHRDGTTTRRRRCAVDHSWNARGSLAFPKRMGAGFFAEPDGRLQSVAPRAGNDIYFAAPHPASDNVLEANNRRVIEFLRTTFFDNALALECQLATKSIANVFGDMHGFIDMNVFYSVDELEKQADTFTGKVRM